MKPEIKKLWVDALRNGEYPQGDNALRKGGKYCCLGVLCDIHRKQTSLTDWVLPTHKDTRDAYKDTRDAYLGNIDFLPEEVVQWAGLSNKNPRVPVIHLDGILSLMNDKGVSFVEISDLVDQHL